MTATAKNNDRRIIRVLVCAAALLLAAGVVRGEEHRSVFVHSAGKFNQTLNPVWVVLVDSRDPQAEKTIVLLREHFPDNTWQRLAPLPARTVAITSQSTELVMLMAGNRQWAWYSQSPSYGFRFSYGPVLPEGAKFAALSGDHKDLWAIGLPISTTPPPSTLATAPASTRPTTNPAIAPLPIDRPTLYALGDGKWTASKAPWPEDALRFRQTQLSMAIIADAPHIALSSGGEIVRIYKHTSKPDAWVRAEEMAIPSTTRHIKLLNLQGRPALWVLDDKGIGEIRQFDRVIAMPFADASPPPDDVDVTIDGDQIRAVFKRDDDKGTHLFEQLYGFDGSVYGKPTELIPTDVRVQPPTELITTAVVTVIAILIISAILRRRGATRDENDGDSED